MPKISVILPVYNAEKYLKQAIDSILSQTFTDFELLIINDGSTDGSEAIILFYDEPRIVYLKNEKNEGLIFSLNRAIDLASGEFIARMDADDVALPERFERQVALLTENKTIAMVAATILFIDEANKEQGVWDLDKKTIRPKLIRRTMAWECCIAHPTIIGRTEIFKRFKYNQNQKNIEDYDLWLRFLNHKMKIVKISDPLLLYRIHSNSITQSSNQHFNPRKRIFNCKRKYLQYAFKNGEFSLFNLKILLTTIYDVIVIIKKSVFK